MTEIIVPIILGVIASGGVWTFVQFLISRMDEKKKQKADKTDKIDKNVTDMQQAMTELASAISTLQERIDKNNTEMSLQNEAIMSIAQDRIVWLGGQYLKQGYVKINDYVTLKRMADAYRALGGNDLVKTTMDEVDLLEKR